MNYAQIKDKVNEIVKDLAAKLEATERDGFIQEALKTYSYLHPRIVVKDITGDGGYEYPFSSLTYWDEGISVIKSVEYPADEREPVYLEEDEFLIYEKEAGRYLRLLDHTPQTTEKIRVIYTALHILTGALNTVPESDQEAVCNLAASLCSGALASIYAHTSDSTIGADSVDHKSKSQEFASRARDQYKNYSRHMGLDSTNIVPASAVGGFDQTYPGGSGRLTHPKKWR